MQPILTNAIPLSERLCQYPIQCHLAYATKENFLGRMVEGYHQDAAHLCLMTPKTALALTGVQNELNQIGLGLFVFDGYRPLRSVKDFARWMSAPVANDYELERKKIHYPHIEKNQLATLGYVSDNVSSHCFGDTVDLALLDLRNNQLLDMGVCFDYFDELAHPTASIEEIGKEGFNNRKLLSEAMQRADFLPFDTEYWHFTLQNRELKHPLDIEITSDLAMT